MGNLNFTYSSSTKALETPSFFYLGALEKKDVAEKKRLNSYTYGFNGMERDDEWNGTGNAYDFGARIYDSRIGRWLAIDKEFRRYPSLSPFSFAKLNPIIFIDPDGNHTEYAITYLFEDGTKMVFEIVVYDGAVELWRNGQYHNQAITAHNERYEMTFDFRNGDFKKSVSDVQRGNMLSFGEVVDQKLEGTNKLVFDGGYYFYTTDGSSVGVLNLAEGKNVESVDATDLIAAVAGFRGAFGGPGTGLNPSKKQMDNAVIFLSETLAKTMQVGGEAIDKMTKAGEWIQDQGASSEEAETITPRKESNKKWKVGRIHYSSNHRNDSIVTINDDGTTTTEVFENNQGNKKE